MTGPVGNNLVFNEVNVRIDLVKVWYVKVVSIWKQVNVESFTFNNFFFLFLHGFISPENIPVDLYKLFITDRKLEFFFKYFIEFLPDQMPATQLFHKAVLNDVTTKGISTEAFFVGSNTAEKVIMIEKDERIAKIEYYILYFFSRQTLEIFCFQHIQVIIQNI